MCVIFLANGVSREYPLILIANRDEFYARPTAPAARWENDPEIFAGRDLVHGGTWLGITGTGRFAAVTNYRDPLAPKGELSRGDLVRGFLASDSAPAVFLDDLKPRADSYSGFNLIVGVAGEAGSEIGYLSNRGAGPRMLGPGIYGLSNHLLDTPWPKVRKGKAELARMISAAVLEADNLFGLLGDKTPAPDAELPSTGVGIELERVLSPIFIETPVYGTRSSSLVLFGKDRGLSLEERVFV
jgi:uncharacterized protein with NRDE domain